LLSVVVNAYRKNKIEDAWLVPVGISYEKFIERGYPIEVLGGKKEPESFFSAIWSTIKLLFQWKKCNVRLDFGQPLSLKDFAEEHAIKLGTLTDAEITAIDSHERQIVMTCGPNNNVRKMPPLPEEGMDIADRRERFFVSNLAKHMVYDSSRSCAVMCTHVLATVVLYSIPAEGCSFTKALDTFNWLCGECKDLDRDLGFRAEPHIAMKYAVGVIISEV
jgi:glycerol-3-phosphate O-acyltransferase 1/2